MNHFWACPKKRCLLPALNSRGKWTPRAVALLHYSIQTVLALSLNPTWALGSAAQLSLFLVLHCIITRSSLHSLPRLCTTPLHCSITRSPLSQLFSLLSPTLQPSGWISLHCSAACSSSTASLVSHISAQGFSVFTAAFQKSSGSATSFQCSVAQPSPGASNLPFSSLLFPINTRLQHCWSIPQLFFLTIFYAL